MIENTRLTSLSLVEGLVAKDDAYRTRLDTLYGPIVHFWIRKTGIAANDIDDLRQEVLLAVATNIGKYKHSAEHSGTLRRWMWGIARHKILDGGWQARMAQSFFY